MRRVAFVFSAIALLGSVAVFRGSAQAPAGLTSKVILDNDRVRVQRLSVPVGFRDPVSVVQNDMVVIQATPGDMEVVINGEKTTGRVDAGKVWYVPKTIRHQFSNAGNTSYDTLVVMLK
jgi:mannose-6-phosphate isomerase-like protein (cupin superfamily)